MAEVASAYVGKQGAGKSHEAVVSVIVPASRTTRNPRTKEVIPARRVLTNVAGIDPDAIAQYIGTERVDVIAITAADLLNDLNYPTLDDGPGLLIEGGDVLVVDEAHIIWPDTYRPTANQMHPRRFRFIAEARHFTDKHGRSCNVVLMTQNIKGIAAFVRQRIGTVFDFRNRGRIGKIFFRNYKKEYRITAYDYDDEKALHRCVRLWTQTRKYKPWAFTMYESVKGGGSVDFQSAAPGTSIWSKGFFVPLVCGVLALVLGFNWATSYFRPDCSSPPEMIMIDGTQVSAVIGGNDVIDITRVVGPDGSNVFVRGRCQWRMGEGGSLQPYELRRSSPTAG